MSVFLFWIKDNGVNLAETAEDAKEIRRVADEANRLIEVETGKDVSKMSKKQYKKFLEKADTLEESKIKSYTLAEREAFWKELKEKHFPENDWNKTNFETDGIDYKKFKSKNKKILDEMTLLYTEEVDARKYLPSIIKSGVTVPKKIIVNKNDKFYKLVSEGSNIDSPSAYYIDKIQLKELKQSPETIEQVLGLPLSSVSKKYSVFEITARSDGNVVFSSKIAPTKQSGVDSAMINKDIYKTTGGGTQILIIDNTDIMKWKKSSGPVDEIIPNVKPKI